MTSRSTRETKAYTAEAKRNTVGEADSETRRRLLREKLNEPTKPTGVAPKPAVPKPATGPVRSTYDQLRLRGKDIDAEIDKRDK